MILRACELELSDLPTERLRRTSRFLLHLQLLVSINFVSCNNRAMSCISCLFSKKYSSTDVKIDEDIHNVRQFTYKELRIATNDFSQTNKIGEGGFGFVYKGTLKDGVIVAIKVLSSESKQGPREFLNELKAIANVSHENLVSLCGCCVEGEHRILVYNYLENNSLSRTLLGGGHCDIEFNWQTRKKICIDVARGLAFLHEELTPHIVHRDIKASNILLDKGLNAKISDFGLAKLIPSNVTHVSTRVAGTIGYLAPEYAVRGHLTRKADIYSFGVLLLEIVSGRCNSNPKLPSEDRFLLERSGITHGVLLLQTWLLYERNELPKIVDTTLEGDYDVDEASRFLKVGLLCTQDSPKLRPIMSSVVKMLTGRKDVNLENVTKPGIVEDFMQYKVKNTQGSDMGSTNTMFSGPDSSEVNSTFPSLTFTAISEREG